MEIETLIPSPTSNAWNGVGEEGENIFLPYHRSDS